MNTKAKTNIHVGKKVHAVTKKRNGIHSWIDILVATTKKWVDDDPFRQSAVIAYYAIFSLPALLLIVLSIAGYFFGHDTIDNKVIDFISSNISPDIATQLKNIIIKSTIGNRPWYAMIIGIATMLSGAVGVFTELQKSLNYIWEVTPKPDQKLLKLIKSNLFSFGLVLSIGFLLLISMVLTTLLTALDEWISIYISTTASVMFHALDFLLSFGFITILFALMFKILPDAQIKWKYIWSGSLLTAFLFVLGKYVLGFYFGKFQPASTYGVAGAIVLILLWFSYSSMILFFGAEFTKQYTLSREGKIVPSPGAVHKKPSLI